MAISHDELLEMLHNEIETISIACKARVKPKEIEQAYEDDEDNNQSSILPLMDRWGDRKVPR